MGLTQTSAPTVEPVTVAELRRVLDYSDEDRDPELNDCLLTARTMVEEYLWSQLITATWEWTMSGFPRELVVPRGPLLTVSSITYLDQDGDEQTVSASVYQVITGFPGRIREAYNQLWPINRIQPESVTVTFTAGYGATASAVPKPIRRAILVLAGQLFEGCPGDGLPESVRTMLSPYRSRDTRTAECVA